MPKHHKYSMGTVWGGLWSSLYVIFFSPHNTPESHDYFALSLPPGPVDRRDSTELFQAQGTKEYQQLAHLKQPDVIFPAVWSSFNGRETLAPRVTRQDKYSAFHLSDRDTRERFGLELSQAAVQSLWIGTNIEPKWEMNLLLLCLHLLSRHQRFQRVAWSGSEINNCPVIFFLYFSNQLLTGY